MENPLLALGDPLPFDQIRAEHVVPGVRQLLEEANQRLQALETDAVPAGYENVLGELERATERLELGMSIVEHLEAVATTPELREAYNTVLPEVSAFWSGIPLRDGLWQRLRDLGASAEARTLEPTRARFLEKTLADFKRHGANLEPGDKERLRALDRDLALVTNRFSQNVLDSTNAFELVLEDKSRLAGLPESALEAARESAQAKGKTGYRFTLQAPSVMAVLTYADDAKLREELYRAYNGRAALGEHDNRKLIEQILDLRRQKAKLLGYRDFADLVTEDRMAKNGAEAERFAAELSQKTRPAFQREAEELLAFRRELEGPNAPELVAWDVAYYSEKLKKARYDFDDEELRPYFAADRVLQGAFELAERLYGVRIVARNDVSVWDSSARAFRMLDGDGSELGVFYVDPYPRENKRGGAWMHGLHTAVPPEPHLAVFCANVNPPAGGKPSLLTHRDVETIFHEFGHLLHHLLSKVTVRSLGGTRVVQDFVELPSQIMENWCSEREGLNLFARHYETGEPIPDHLLERLRAARTFRAATFQMRQLGFAMVDLSLHRSYDPAKNGDPLSYGNDILAAYSAAPLPRGFAMLASFLHLFSHPVGYAAGYYSYKWAEVLDADAFSRFKSEGVLSQSVGGAFRHELLERGDSRDPLDLFVAFMGRPPRVEALLERLGLAS
ncbi:MAG TPA: M3 family metallopeptidase [Polyangiaceae bacterium]|nr:M3 family metallopeptidase [Polyangiaceae bacterium]